MQFRAALPLSHKEIVADLAQLQVREFLCCRRRRCLCCQARAMNAFPHRQTTCTTRTPARLEDEAAEVSEEVWKRANCFNGRLKRSAAAAIDERGGCWLRLCAARIPRSLRTGSASRTAPNEATARAGMLRARVVCLLLIRSARGSWFKQWIELRSRRLRKPRGESGAPFLQNAHCLAGVGGPAAAVLRAHTRCRPGMHPFYKRLLQRYWRVCQYPYSLPCKRSAVQECIHFTNAYCKGIGAFANILILFRAKDPPEGSIVLGISELRWHGWYLLWSTILLLRGNCHTVYIFTHKLSNSGYSFVAPLHF